MSMLKSIMRLRSFRRGEGRGRAGETCAFCTTGNKLGRWAEPPKPSFLARGAGVRRVLAISRQVSPVKYFLLRLLASSQMSVVV